MKHNKSIRQIPQIQERADNLAKEVKALKSALRHARKRNGSLCEWNRQLTEQVARLK